MRAAAELVSGAQAVVFDLDGTLADTVQDLWLALLDALRGHGLPGVGLPVVLRSLHGGLLETARAALAELGETKVSYGAFSLTYAHAYRQRGHQATHLYDGAAVLLDALTARGIPVGVCTNKDAADATALLRRLGVGHYVNCVIGPDTTGFAKPAPEPLLHTLKRLGCSPAQAVFVGDSAVDAECAAAAGVPFVLHANGFGAAALAQYRARFEHFGELLASSPAGATSRTAAPSRTS